MKQEGKGAGKKSPAKERKKERKIISLRLEKCGGLAKESTGARETSERGGRGTKTFDVCIRHRRATAPGRKHYLSSNWGRAVWT